jgi:hypothetical protein
VWFKGLGLLDQVSRALFRCYSGAIYSCPDLNCILIWTRIRGLLMLHELLNLVSWKA